MSAGLGLDGSMIPRSVKRMFDGRGEPREATAASAVIEWRDKTIAVELANLSQSGAMVICGKIPHIGEAMTLKLPDHDPVPGVVTWVRDGRIGIHFAAPLK